MACLTHLHGPAQFCVSITAFVWQQLHAGYWASQRPLKSDVPESQPTTCTNVWGIIPASSEFGPSRFLELPGCFQTLRMVGFLLLSMLWKNAMQNWTNLSEVFFSKGEAGPLAWPRGSNEEPEKLTEYWKLYNNVSLWQLAIATNHTSHSCFGVTCSLHCCHWSRNPILK